MGEFERIFLLPVHSFSKDNQKLIKNNPPEGQVPTEGRVITLSRKTEGIEVPMDTFMEYTKIPIIIYYGDNLPQTDEYPELYEWTR
jgi:hypothetical protein